MVLNWLIEKVYEVFKMLNEKQFYPLLNSCYMIGMVSKTFRDLYLTYHSFTLFGTVLLHTGFYS